MNHTLFTDAREGVFLGLYAETASSSPGSDRANIAERALTLALSDGREDDFLDRNVRRDARKSEFRNRRTERELVNRIRSRTAEGRFVAGAESIESSAEAHYLAEALCTELRRVSASTGNNGEAVYEAMLTGLTIKETAFATGLSTATVERTRKTIRAAADSWMNVRAA